VTSEKQVKGWKVRIVMPSITLHFVSATEPRLRTGAGGHPLGIDWVPTGEGETPGFIDWEHVYAVTWRAPTAGDGNNRGDR
jgi:hypothetical protein